MSRRLAVAVFALGILASLLVACTGGEDDASPSATATATSTATPTSSPTPEPTEPPTATPTGLPNVTPMADGSGPTGSADLNRIIEAVEARDVLALRDLVEYQLIGCTHADGLGGRPKCLDHEEEGDEVSVFPASACEREWVRTATQRLGAFAHTADGLWAALEVGSYPTDGLVPAPDTLLVFHDLRDGTDLASYLLVNDGRIVGTGLVCFGPLEDLLSSPSFALKVSAGPWDEPRERESDAPTTGIAALDEVLRAVAEYDLATLVEGAQRAQADLPGLACSSPLQGIGGIECDTVKGEQDGDIVSVFPLAFCEGSLARSPALSLAAFLDRVPQLHAVVEPPVEPSQSDLYPHGAYWVVYELTGIDAPAPNGVRLHVTEDGDVTVIWYGCGASPEDLASWSDEPLAEIPFTLRESELPD